MTESQKSIDSTPTQDLGIMSYEDYAKIAPEIFPYSYELDKDGIIVHYFGGNHSIDPTDPQFNQLKREFDDFLIKVKPESSIVLVEGRVLENPGEGTAGSENGFITILARQAGVVVECPEPDTHIQYAQLRQNYSEDEILLYYFARDLAVRLLDGGKSDLADYMKKSQEFHEQKLGVDYSLEHLVHLVETTLGVEFDPNSRVWMRLWDPVRQDTIINKVARTSSQFRDLTIVRGILEQLNQGKNVFAVFGGTHAVMQEPALRKAFRLATQ